MIHILEVPAVHAVAVSSLPQQRNWQEHKTPDLLGLHVASTTLNNRPNSCVIYRAFHVD